MKRLHFRVYADTSVFGGVYDPEFTKPSVKFFELVEAGLFRLVTSVVVQREIAIAPRHIRSFFNRKRQNAIIAHISDESIALRDAYLHAGIVDNKSLDDALHVALATVSGCHLIVSWNFRHIVNFRRISLYNEVNKENGYAEISIHSPMEVIENEK